MFEYGYTPSTMPCKQDCTNRTYSCKFDGSCSKWLAYQLTLKKKPFSEDYQPNKGKRSLQPVGGGRR